MGGEIKEKRLLTMKIISKPYGSRSLTDLLGCLERPGESEIERIKNFAMDKFDKTVLAKEFLTALNEIA